MNKIFLLKSRCLKNTSIQNNLSFANFKYISRNFLKVSKPIFV